MKTNKDYDFIVVGSGFSGAIIARLIAEQLNKKVLIVEKRSHIAGNMYDEYDDSNILIQKYGVHVFRTDDKEIFTYLSRFTDWKMFNIKCLACINDTFVPVPFNFSTIDSFFMKRADSLKDKLKETSKDGRIDVLSLINSSDPDLVEFGNFLFENDYLPYTCKQWGKTPSEIDKSILERVKIAASYDERFFTNKYQGVPLNGFTELFLKILDHSNIDIVTNTNIIDHISLEKDYIKTDLSVKTPLIIYTGALDELFNYSEGILPYRSLIFRYETHEMNYYQTAPFVVYPKDEEMTRIIEFKQITGQKIDNKTTIMKEYPIQYVPGNDYPPYYPIICQDNVKMHEKYCKIANKYQNLLYCGRLADYKYYYMDEAIKRSFELFEKIKNNNLLKND